MSMRITLLQAVKFKPVLPALKEIRMTLTFGSSLIAFKDTSRSLGFIDPSTVSRESVTIRADACRIIIDSHRTNFTLSSFKKGSIKSSILVNCEKMIVFSFGSLSSISLRILSIMRILADVGRSSSARFAAWARGTQPVQWVFHSPSPVFVGLSLREWQVRG
jgi:hypothetical protein